MASQLKPFPIKEFKTGIYQYLEPWIRPVDAFDPLINAYIYRGTLNKRNGYTVFGNQVQAVLYITGISLAASAVITASNSFTMDDYGVTTVTFYSVEGMTEINGLTGTVQSSTAADFVVNINSSGFTPYTGAGIAVYSPLNNLSDPIMGIMRYIDQSTSLSELVVATTRTLFLYNAGTNQFEIVGTTPIFTGNITNFFNWTNWQATIGATSYLWMCNNKDPVTRFDGTNADQPTLAIDSTGTPQTITTCQDIKVYKQRLLFIRPTLSTDGIQNQSIYWSAVSNPTNVINDVAGNGGALAAPTGDTIVSTQFIRDVLVVFMTNSTWLFRFTGIDTNPFRWDKLNDSKSSNAPYASIPYDQRVTSVGSTGFIACDGVNVQRYDIPIIDYYETEMSEQYYAQAFSQRYDNLNQSWMLYVSNGSENPLVGGVAPGSDKALVYNFVENSWATYTFPVPFTCLGIFYAVSGTTWQQLTQTWEDTDAAWKSYSSQKLAPILLGGDTTGNVYWLDNDLSVTDNGSTIIPNITSTRWNPFIELGQKTEFAYIDFYYAKSSVNPADPVVLTLSFFVDNSNNPALVRTLTLDAPLSSDYQWKRVYCNLTGQFIQMNIDPDEDSDFQVLGMILWAKPAGRITP